MSIDKVKIHFELLGFEVDDIQKDDRSVGIFTGWVLFRCRKKKNQKWREISWSDAEWHTFKNNKRVEILKDSIISKELN